MVGDLGALMRQHVRWQVLAPNLQPYYPVKCNSSPAIIEVLASLGLGFVCTNKVGLSSTKLVVTGGHQWSLVISYPFASCQVM